MVQVYKDVLCRRQHAAVFSVAVALRLLGYLACVVLAYIIAHASGDMWRKVKTIPIQPNVSFSSNALAYFAAEDPAVSKIWTTSAAANQLLGSQLAVASIQVTNYDFNYDGKNDRIQIQLSVTDMPSVVGCNILLEFVYGIENGIHLEARGLAYVQHSAGSSGGGLDVTGTLQLRQQDTLRAGTRRPPVSPLLFDPDQTFRVGPSSPFDIPSILRANHMRNETTVLADQQKFWRAGFGPFQANINVFIPHQQLISYRPKGVTEFKFGFIQWLAIFAVLAAAFAWFESTLFASRALDTYCTYDVMKSQVRSHGPLGLR